MADIQIQEEALNPLSERELAILRLMADGLSNQEIADRLFLALTTIKWYIRQINDKLDTHSRTQTVARAHQLKLVGENATARVAFAEAHEPPENPYKGLLAFRESDSEDFFGRETFIRRLIERLGEKDPLSRFLAVVGPSGSGKSSTVKAGLIPALRHGELPGSETWLVAEMLPGTHPLEELELALLRVAAKQPPSLLPQLREDERGLLRAVRRVLPDDGGVLVLVIDQFEEVFTLVENEFERQHFLNSLYVASTDARSPLRLIITLRADFYDRPLLYTAFGELTCQRTEAVLPLTVEELEQVITRPAARVDVTVEPGLVAAMVSEVNQQPGALPLLQYALTEMFDHCQGTSLTLEAYRAIGGVTGALARRADGLYEGLDDAGQETARQMFLRLVTLGEGVEDTRRRAHQSELLSIASHGAAMDDIIQTFAAYRLLTLDHDLATRTPTLELAHEAILREWKRLRVWLDESRADVRMGRLLAGGAAEWLDAKRDPGFLLSGSKLAQFEEWAAASGLELTADERAYLDASVMEREWQAALEHERQEREARLKRRSRYILRALVVVLLLAMLGAFGLTGIAQRSEAEARGLALASAAQLALNEGNADQAIQLAEAALQIADDSLARRILEQAAYAPGSPRIFPDLAGFVPRVLTLRDTDLTFVMVGHSGNGDPFWRPAIKGMEDACTLLQAHCYWLSEPLFGDKEMADHWEEALALDPDGIGTTVFNPEVIRSGVERAAELGIPVVAFNSADPYAGTDRALPTLLYIGEDGFLSGRSNARRVFAEAEADGMTIQRGVCTIQGLGISALESRCAGVKSVFDEHGVPLDKIQISNDPYNVVDVLSGYFADHPESNAIFMGGPNIVSGFNLYIQQAGLKPHQIYATTHDISEEIFQMIRDGYLLQTVDQKPYMQGFQTIMSLYLYRQYGLRPGGFINTSSVVDQSNVDLVAKLVEMGYR